MVRLVTGDIHGMGVINILKKLRDMDEMGSLVKKLLAIRR